MRSRSRAAVFLLPLVLLLLSGCPFITTGGDTPPPPPSDYRPQTSVSNVLYNLKKAYQEFNYDQYVRLLDESYTYIFAPQDIGKEGIPPWWGLSDERVSAGNLFSKTVPNREGYIAESASLSFVSGPEIPNDVENWTKVVLSQIFLTITTRNKVTGDPLDYLVQGDQANLWFVQRGVFWYIVKWEDKPIAGAAAARPLVASE